MQRGYQWTGRKRGGDNPWCYRLQSLRSDLSVGQNLSLCVGVWKENRQAGITPCDAAAAQGRGCQWYQVQRFLYISFSKERTRASLRWELSHRVSPEYRRRRDSVCKVVWKCAKVWWVCLKLFWVFLEKVLRLGKIQNQENNWNEGKNSVWCQKSEAEGVKSFRRKVMGLGKMLVQKIQIQVDREFTTLVKIRTV